MTKADVRDSELIRSGGRRTYIVVLTFASLVIWLIVAAGVLRWKNIDAPSIALLVLSLLTLLKFVRSGTELTAEGIGVRRIFRTRRVPWGEINKIDVAKVPGGRQVSLSLQNRKIVKLPAPGEWWTAVDEEFDTKVGLLRQWWERHRSRHGDVGK